MKTEKRQTKWRNGKIHEEYEVFIFEYKGEPKCVKTGTSKNYEVDGILKEECDYEITTYRDREGNSFYGHSKKTKKHYAINGGLKNTETWVPVYGSPYGGPGSLHTFTLKERIEH